MQFSDMVSTWRLTISNTKARKAYEESADFVLTVIGRFNAWRLPTYPAVKDYRKPILHTLNWDTGFDPSGKNGFVSDTGVGGIEVVPALCKIVKCLEYRGTNLLPGSGWESSRENIRAIFDRSSRSLQPALNLILQGAVSGCGELLSERLCPLYQIFGGPGTRCS